MLFIFSTLQLIRHLWQLKTIVFLHWCLICTLLLVLWLSKLVCLSLSVTYTLFACTNQHSSLFRCWILSNRLKSCMKKPHCRGISIKPCLSEFQNVEENLWQFSWSAFYKNLFSFSKKSQVSNCDIWSGTNYSV